MVSDASEVGDEALTVETSPEAVVLVFAVGTAAPLSVVAGTAGVDVGTCGIGTSFNLVERSGSGDLCGICTPNSGLTTVDFLTKLSVEEVTVLLLLAVILLLLAVILLLLAVVLLLLAVILVTASFTVFIFLKLAFEVPDTKELFLSGSLGDGICCRFSIEGTKEFLV